MSKQPTIRRIIIRTPNFIGDTINTTPCLELVKQEYPDAELVIVGPDFTREIFKYDKRVCGYITFPLSKKNKFSTYWHIVKELRFYHGDLGIIFINTFISALLFKLGGIKCNIGYQQEGRGFLLDFKPKLDRTIHYINRYATLFNQYVGNKYVTLPELYLPVSGKKTFDFGNTQKTICFYPGGEKKGYRSYPASYSIRLIQLLHQKGYNIVLIGDKNDLPRQEEYLKAADCKNIINLTGKTNIEDFFNTISNSDLLITIDSAAMHTAAALKIPFIALMGLSTSPTSMITPKVTFGQVLKIENNLIQPENYIQNITPEIILESVKELLLN